MEEPPELETVIAELDEQVAIITLNRPDVLNAWNGPLNRDLTTALAWARDDDQVGAVVITGAGRAFCAGADLSSGGDTFADDANQSPDDDRQARTLTLLPWDLPKPVIAAINGHAVGVGATYALACDLRFAAHEAKIGFVFSRRGMLPELASHAVLPRVVGFSNAADLLLSGRPVTGREAATLGLVSASTDAEAVLDLAIERARDMAVNAAPVSMAISKRLMWDSMGVAEMMTREHPLFDWVAAQPDSVEGVTSFLEKREPRWNLSASTDFPHDLYHHPETDQAHDNEQGEKHR